MSTTKDLSYLLGARGQYRVQRDGMVVDVIVSDARKTYGSIDLLIVPVAGAANGQWVAFTSVSGLRVA